MVPFVPAKGRRVGWYICGPTTYDSSHLGHARNYVTFDVIRRILSDYFNYDVFSVMNITDVDDKIIRRARQEMLFGNYVKENPTITEELLTEVKKAVEMEIESCKKKIMAIKEDPEKSDAERIGETKLLSKRTENAELLLKKEFPSFKVGSDSQRLLLTAKESFAEQLDAKLKESVGNFDIRPFASKFEKEYLDDMATLNVRMPDVLTRVSEYIPEIIAYVQKIIDNGYAYESNGSVYFDTEKYMNDGSHDYGKLAPSKVGNSRAQQEADGALSAGQTDKRNGNDFVLWKNSKVGEPHWDSPWGKGRPGWHIECSAMASELLGDVLDIHSGGQDLYFPHHENEIAQCEAFFHDKGCKQWVNYFLHSGHLHIDGLKMAKSLKNFITIRQAMEPPYNYTPKQLRLFFVTRPWNKAVNFEKDTMEEVFAWEKTFDSFFANIHGVMRQNNNSQSVTQAWNAKDKELNDAILECKENVHNAFCQNFDTRTVITSLIALVKQANVYFQEPVNSQKVFLLSKAGEYVTKMLSVMGLVEGSDAIGWSKSAEGSSNDELIESFYQFRQTVRQTAMQKGDVTTLLTVTDHVRDNVLPLLGVKFDDSERGWKRIDPKKAKAEIEEKKRLELAKLEKKLKAAKNDFDLLLKQQKPPTSVVDREEFAEFDDKGFPTKMKDGTEIPKNKLKTLSKQWKAQEAAHSKFLQKAKGNEDGLIEEAKNRISTIEQEIQTLQGNSNNNNNNNN